MLTRVRTLRGIQVGGVPSPRGGRATGDDDEMGGRGAVGGGCGGALFRCGGLGQDTAPPAKRKMAKDAQSTGAARKSPRAASR